MTTVAIVQARMGSTRLPGKVMKTICGTPMIGLLLHRLAQAESLDSLALATSSAPENEPLREYVSGLGFDVFVGSEDDVLDRYYQAAQALGAKRIVRITGDCPLVDPDLVDTVVAELLNSKVDYCNNVDPPTYPNGLDVEAFTFAALEDAWRQASEPRHREHVTLYLRESKDVNVARVMCDSDYSELRWTVDEPEDFAVVASVFEHFAPQRDFSWRDVLSLNQQRPELFQANKGFKRNEGSEMTNAQKLQRRAQRAMADGVSRHSASLTGKHVVFRAEGSNQIGAGHLARSLTLAKHLRQEGAQVTFICRERDGGLDYLVSEQEFEAIRLPRSAKRTQGSPSPKQPDWLGASWSDDADETRRVLSAMDSRPDWLVVDSYGIDARWEQALKGSTARIFAIDDLANRDHDCDMLLDQNLVAGFRARYRERAPNVRRLLLGPRFALVGAEYAEFGDRGSERSGRVRRVLVYFGAGDANNVLGRVLAILHDVPDPGLRIDAVVSPSSPFLSHVLEQAGHDERVTLHRGLPSLAPLMAEADLAIGAGGATTWERLCMGLPSAVVTLADNQRPIAEHLDSLGLAVWLGDEEELEDEDLRSRIHELLHAGVDSELPRRCASIVDGRGARRVSRAMSEISVFPFRARLADTGDEDLLLMWRNDPEVRQMSFTVDAVDPKTHRAWFAAKLKNRGGTRIYVVESAEDHAVGQVRCERVGSLWEVHYSLAAEFRRRGFGADVLQAAIDALSEEFGEVSVVGRVRADNPASRRVFTELGFREDLGCKTPVAEYRYQLN